MNLDEARNNCLIGFKLNAQLFTGTCVYILYIRLVVRDYGGMDQQAEKSYYVSKLPWLERKMGYIVLD